MLRLPRYSREFSALASQARHVLCFAAAELPLPPPAEMMLLATGGGVHPRHRAHVAFQGPTTFMWLRPLEALTSQCPCCQCLLTVHTTALRQLCMQERTVWRRLALYKLAGVTGLQENAF
jgi:hypothetical protein